MAEMIGTHDPFSYVPPRVTEWQRFKKVFFSRGIVRVGLIILIIFWLTAIFANWLAPYDPNKQDLSKTFLRPCQEHLLGTDNLGRDTLSRLIYGSRVAFIVGFVSVAIASTVGITLGLLAGYFEGIINMVIMRFIDTLMSLPAMLLMLIIASLLGGGIKNVIIALSIVLISTYTRVMCGQTLSIKQNEYVLAEQAIGSRKRRIIFRHIFPNAFPPIIVIMTMELGALILAEAALSFLGIGIEPPNAAWGGMIKDGYRYLMTDPMLCFAPGAAIMLVVTAFNIVGDGLRDALDPKLRGKL